MSSLPHRYSEKAFRKYESIIVEAVDRFPASLEVKPEHLGLSLETVRGRLRDAITSLHNNLWSPTKVNMVKFFAIHSEIVVSLRPDGRVMVGDKDTVKSISTVPFDSIDPNDVIDMTDKSDFHQLSLMCYLAHHGALRKKIKVRLTPAEVDGFCQSYDVTLIQQTDNSYLLT
jgi:hypothetical protein